MQNKIELGKRFPYFASQASHTSFVETQLGSSNCFFNKYWL